MPLWGLVPVDPFDPNWKASSCRGRVVVRALDEERARNAAEKAFGVKVRFTPGAGITAPPWNRPALVRAEVIRNDHYEEKGPTEMLFPSP